MITSFHHGRKISKPLSPPLQYNNQSIRSAVRKPADTVAVLLQTLETSSWTHFGSPQLLCIPVPLFCDFSFWRSPNVSVASDTINRPLNHFQTAPRLLSVPRFVSFVQLLGMQNGAVIQTRLTVICLNFLCKYPWIYQKAKLLYVYTVPLYIFYFTIKSDFLVIHTYI